MPCLIPADVVNVHMIEPLEEFLRLKELGHEDSGEQLLLYSHLASEISSGKKIATRFLVLTKTKEPVIEEHVREVEPGNVKRTLAGVERVWRAIESGVFYPTPSTMNCASCGYRAACRAWVG